MCVVLSGGGTMWCPRVSIPTLRQIAFQIKDDRDTHLTPPHNKMAVLTLTLKGFSSSHPQGDGCVLVTAELMPHI